MDKLYYFPLFLNRLIRLLRIIKAFFIWPGYIMVMPYGIDLGVGYIVYLARSSQLAP